MFRNNLRISIKQNTKNIAKANSFRHSPLLFAGNHLSKSVPMYKKPILLDLFYCRKSNFSSFISIEVDPKLISLSQSLYLKGLQSPVPSLSQGILFIKSVMFVRLYAAVCREPAVYGNNRSRYKSACVIVCKPHQSADKVGNFTEFLHGSCSKDFARSRRRRAVFVE